MAEHYFRHEYSRLVARLARQVGIHHLDLIEDAVQSALVAALESWRTNGMPDHPSAWLYRVASNQLLGHLKQNSNHQRILTQYGNELIGEQGINSDELATQHINDDLLQMLLVCCNEKIPIESQLILALKILCGFGINEISQRLFCSEASVYKRYSRAKIYLRDANVDIFELNDNTLEQRLPRIHKILYTLFTEGYLSVNSEFQIRLELCNESIRLTTILTEHPHRQAPETFALLALMYLHSARMSGRQDSTGGLLLLEEQDRTLWDQEKIHTGLNWLEKSATGDNFSQYHAEAGIAAEHCLAPTFAQTRWDRIVQCYLLLEQQTSSAVHRLNRAVAMAEWKGPQAGLEILNECRPPAWLSGSYLWCAVMADLNMRCGNKGEAFTYREKAVQLAPTRAIKNLLERRFNKISELQND